MGFHKSGLQQRNRVPVTAGCRNDPLIDSALGEYTQYTMYLPSGDHEAGLIGTSASTTSVSVLVASAGF